MQINKDITQRESSLFMFGSSCYWYCSKFRSPRGHRKPQHSFLNLAPLAYVDEALVRFSEVYLVSHPVLDAALPDKSTQRKYIWTESLFLRIGPCEGPITLFQSMNRID